MTTSLIAASNLRPSAAGATPREGSAAEGRDFSAVLSLRLGMGLNAAVGTGPKMQVAAQEVLAEPARRGEPRAAGDGGGVGFEDERIEPTDEREAAEKRGDTAAVGTGGVRASGVTAVAEPEADAKAPTSPDASTSGPESSAAAIGVKVSERAGAAEQTTSVETNVPREVAMAAAVVSEKVGSTPTEARAEAVVASTVAAKAETAASGRETLRRGDAVAGRRGAARGVEEEGATEPKGAARDPLGLIRERRVETDAQVPDEAGGREVPQKLEASADLSGSGRSGSGRGSDEFGRTQFADAEPQAGAARVAASGGAVVSSGVASPPQGFASVVTGASVSGGVGGIGAASGTGGSGVGGAGVGGGGANDFGGLLNSGAGGGPAFGVAFGTAVRAGKGVTGAAAKGDSKEQIQVQISRGLAAALRQKGGVMSLRLNPEHLGSMKIDLTIESGRVTAVFDAQSEQARQILREGVDGLKRSIEHAGLTVKSIEVVGVTPAALAEPARLNERASQGTPDHAQGQQQTGHGGSHEQRDGGRDDERARGEVGAIGGIGEVEAESEVGGVWAESDGSASGLLRLRVDAVV